MATLVSGASDASPGVREGDVIGGKYRIDKLIGTGGMGSVYAAHHLQLDEKVAIKFLPAHAVGDPDSAARFSREAKAAVKIKSEHVARVIDTGTLDDGAPYIVMEHLDGGDLAALVQKEGPLDVEQAVEFVLQACEAIAEAHALGIVHRDLKPANLFCVRRADGLASVKVLDFGISKVSWKNDDGDAMAMTKTTDVMGSPLYMSPEQLQSTRDVDARADIWSLGVILYELLAGKVPFSGKTLPEVSIQIATQPPPSVRSLSPDVPAGVEKVIERCLAKDRNDRYANVAELAVALAPFAPKRARASVERIARTIHVAGLSSDELEPPPSAGPMQLVVPRTMASQTNNDPVVGSRVARGVVAAVVVLAALAGARALLRRAPTPPVLPTTTQPAPTRPMPPPLPAATPAAPTASAEPASSAPPEPVGASAPSASARPPTKPKAPPAGTRPIVTPITTPPTMTPR